mmetsp:Transcript_12170/g.24255  ORF Transcript_12170/g.24255 Transcript_12170/m.24255 type:complete len:231 (-) Transcript_12170:366-1058(-)
MLLMMSKGKAPVPSTSDLPTTVTYSGAGVDGASPTAHYTLEGSITHCGSIVQWLQDRLKIIDSAVQSTEYAASLEINAGMYFVPASLTLGRKGMHRRDGGGAHQAECVPGGTWGAHLVAMAANLSWTLGLLWVGRNMAVSDFTMQFQAKMLNLEVIGPVMAETTAAGAAYAAGLAAGVWDTLVPENKLCAPDMSPTSRLSSHATPPPSRSRHTPLASLENIRIMWAANKT